MTTIQLCIEFRLYTHEMVPRFHGMDLFRGPYYEYPDLLSLPIITLRVADAEAKCHILSELRRAMHARLLQGYPPVIGPYLIWILGTNDQIRELRYNVPESLLWTGLFLRFYRSLLPGLPPLENYVYAETPP